MQKTATIWIISGFGNSFKCIGKLFLLGNMAWLKLVLVLPFQTLPNHSLGELQTYHNSTCLIALQAE